jgi:hypothetical protein
MVKSSCASTADVPCCCGRTRATTVCSSQKLSSSFVALERYFSKAVRRRATSAMSSMEEITICRKYSAAKSVARWASSRPSSLWLPRGVVAFVPAQ